MNTILSSETDNNSPSSSSRIFFAEHIKPEYVNCRGKSYYTNSDCCEHGPIGHAETLRFGLEIAKGMEHLEAKGIVHRDLAARNILMNEHRKLKVK